MLNIKKAIEEDIKKGIKKANETGDLIGKLDKVGVVVDVPERVEHGNYASPIALRLVSSVKGKSPMEIVQIIVDHMPKNEYIGRIKAVEPGYLNVWLNPGWMTSRLDNIIQQDLCEEIDEGKGRSANLEFISANPTGPLTLGNIRSAFSVDALGNVLECAGFNVTREYYFNDSGAQVKKLGESVLRRILQEQGEKIDYSEELYQGDYIKEIGRQVAESFKENEGREFKADDLSDGELIEKIGDITAGLLIAEIRKTVVNDLKIKFDVWTSEGELRKKGKVKKVINKLKAGNHVYEKNGAVYLKTTEFGDDEDRIIIKSDGEYAYIAPDIAYHQDKYDRGFDEIFTFVGTDHQGHLLKVRAAMEALGNDLGKLHQVTNQWMGFLKDGKSVKLSKRAGAIVTPGELIEEVGYDVARFLMIQHTLASHMDLDIDVAKEKSERNPVYYVQYAYVRLQSILRQAKERGVIEDIGVVFDLSDSPALTHTLELNLMREMYRFPEVVGEIAEDWEIHKLAYYALDLAKAVHVFYRHVPVLGEDDEQMIKNRLQLVLAAKKVMEKTLDLLGIGKPEVM